MERLNLLVSDLDGTLLGDCSALHRFKTWYECACQHFRLVYTSGRFIDSILDSIRREQLPVPDAIVGGVGTEIYDVKAARRIVTWPTSTFEWNPYLVQSVADSFRQLKLQPEHLLSYYKVSYYGHDLNQSFLDRLMLRLTAAGICANVVYSSRRDLDIVPAETDKGKATEFLVRRWGIDRERVIVAGDSGNDADMLNVGFRGIVVGNAQSELKSLNSPSTYHAKSMFAEGVLEGVAHWLKRFLPKQRDEGRKYASCPTKASRECYDFEQRDSKVANGSQLADSNFPWMLL